jgi:hypothetical protein
MHLWNKFFFLFKNKALNLFFSRANLNLSRKKCPIKRQKLPFLVVLNEK